MAAWEKEHEKNKKTIEKSAEDEITATQKIINQLEAAAATNTQTQIDAVPEQYRNVERAVGARQIANERNLTESMARAGATGSGYSDTHQAMVNISAGNQYADIDLKKRAAIDNLTQTLADLQSKFAQQETAQITDINRQASMDIANNRTSLYNNYLQTEAQKAAAVQQARTAQIQADAKARVEQDKQQNKLLEAQRKLMIDYTGEKITPEQYNAVAESYGLSKVAVPPPTGSSGTYGKVEPYSSKPNDYGAQIKSAINNGEIIDYEAVNHIINEYPNDKALQAQAARIAGVYDVYQQLINPSSNQKSSSSNSPVRDPKSRQIK